VTLTCSIPPAVVVNGAKLFSGINRYEISELIREDSQANNIDQEP
jgi:hypothetical protein